MPLHEALLLDLTDGVQKLLRPADRKRRNDHAAAPVKGALQNSGKLSNGISGLLMQAVSVGGFDDKIIGSIYMLRIFDDRLVNISDISGKYDFFAYTVFCDPDFNAGRTKQMTDICEAEFDSFTELDRLVIIDRRKKCLPVPPFCFGFLDMCTVTEHNAAQIRGGECTDDFSFKTIFYKQRNLAGMVNVCMC